MAHATSNPSPAADASLSETSEVEVGLLAATMAHATSNPSPAADASLCETELTKMVKHVINIGVLEELRLSKRSIYKVPCNLRKVKEEAYTPQCISIGPIHLNKQELNPMQEHKLRYFTFFWNRVSNEQAMMNYKHYLETKEEEIRQCYAEKFPDMAKEKLVDMMLLDAVFIMELFLRNCHNNSKQTKSFRDRQNDDIILTQSWLSRNITRDLILLENQIPFFVLHKLYDDVVPDDNKKKEHTCFVDLAIEYFAFYDTQMSSSHDRSEEPKHFTDLIRCFYLPADHDKCYSDLAHNVLRTATKLRDSGVCFENGDVKRRLLDVTFDKTPILSLFLCFGCLPFLNHFRARFRIPQLKLDHTTECVFRNLIAFEQCHYPQKPYICNYVCLLDSLIHTKLDVELLVEKEVIVHELGSDKEVATLVNGLCKHVVTNSTCYSKTIKKLNDHYMNNWNHTVAALRLVYFKDLWRTSSTVVGIAVLVFAVIQFLRVVGVTVVSSRMPKM